MNRNISSTLAACAAFMLAAGAVSADPKEGSIMGFVRDAAGKPLSHVQMLITNTGEVALTDNNGKFTFVGEDPQPYALRASLDGYQAVTAKVVVVAGGTASVDIALKIRIPIAVRKVTRGGKTSSPITLGDLHRVPPPDPFAGGPLVSFPGDVSLHSTARSR